MQNGTLHADHIDETGAYSRRFEVVKELIDNGTLTEIPQEFRPSGTQVQQREEVVPVVDSKFRFEDEFGQRHADHVDETGEYRRAWEAKFGPMVNNNNGEEDNSTPANTEWKSFLQQLIAEEKSKLNI